MGELPRPNGVPLARNRFRTSDHWIAAPTGHPSGRGPCQDRGGRRARQSGSNKGADLTMTGPVGPESEVERTLGTLASLNPAYVLDHTDRAGRADHDRRHLPDPPDADGAPGDPARRRHGQRRGRRAGGVCRPVPELGRTSRPVNAAIGYLRTAVVNGSRSMLRRRRTARAYVPPDPGTARSAESLAMLSTEHQAVVSALGDLAPRQREVLVLRYYGGLSEAEIAEATGLSKGTVKSTASRAVAKLGEIMRTTHS